MSDDQAALNTDIEIWRRTPGDYYSPSIHVTRDGGGIGMNLGGTVIVLPIELWFAAAKKELGRASLTSATEGEPDDETALKAACNKLGYSPNNAMVRDVWDCAMDYKRTAGVGAESDEEIRKWVDDFGIAQDFDTNDGVALIKGWLARAESSSTTRMPTCEEFVQAIALKLKCSCTPVAIFDAIDKLPASSGVGDALVEKLAEEMADVAEYPENHGCEGRTGPSEKELIKFKFQEMLRAALTSQKDGK